MKMLTVVIMLATAVLAKPDAPDKPDKPAKPKADVTEKKISFDTGKKDKEGKKIIREFPVMFDISSRAQKHKDKKAGKK